MRLDPHQHLCTVINRGAGHQAVTSYGYPPGPKRPQIHPARIGHEVKYFFSRSVDPYRGGIRAGHEAIALEGYGTRCCSGIGRRLRVNTRVFWRQGRIRGRACGVISEEAGDVNIEVQGQRKQVLGAHIGVPVLDS